MTKTSCVYCDKEIDIEEDNWVIGETPGEHWCEECVDTGSDER